MIRPAVVRLAVVAADLQLAALMWLIARGLGRGLLGGSSFVLGGLLAGQRMRLRCWVGMSRPIVNSNRDGFPRLIFRRIHWRPSAAEREAIVAWWVYDGALWRLDMAEAWHKIGMAAARIAAGWSMEGAVADIK